ncbi:MAG: ABC transporter transmembrane domain-containing protein [Amphritea sp.]
MDRRLSKFIYRYSARDQIRVSLLTLFVFPILYLSLELPKTIINGAIERSGSNTFLGMQWQPVQFLLLLCGLLLLTVLVNGLFKMRINTYKGIIGERMVRRLRYQLMERVQRFPPAQFQRVSQGEIIATITSETEPLAGFIGDSLAQPLFQGGTMLTILTFMFVQDPVLGAVAVSMIPLQAYIIPKMQKRLNALKKQRVKQVRVLASKIGESVDGNREVRTNGTQQYHLAHFSQILGELFTIRLNIFQQKFLMKFINNFLNQLPPIMFYAVGGVLVINGQLSMGALVAALTAYKDLVSPWKELLAYYQQYQDSKVRYEQILENFDPPDLIQLVPQAGETTQALSGSMAFNNLYLKNERGEYIAKNINLEVEPGDLVTIHSDSPFLLRKLAQSMMRSDQPASGIISYGNEAINQISTSRLTRNVSYAGPEPFLFDETILQNINYGLRRLPPVEEIDQLEAPRLTEISEAEASGNSSASAHEIWTDFDMAGVESWLQLRNWLQDLMVAIGSRHVVFELGLKDHFDPKGVPGVIAETFIETRVDLMRQAPEVKLESLVDSFDINSYHRHLSVLENISFGLICPDHEMDIIKTLIADESFIQLLRQHNLYRPLRDVGEQVSRCIIAELSEVGPEEQLKPDMSQYDSEGIREQLAQCIGRPEHMPACEFLLEMALKVRMGAFCDEYITASLQSQIIELRHWLIEQGRSNLNVDIEPLRSDSINARLSVMENLVWGIEIAPKQETQHQALVAVVEQALVDNNAESLVLITIGLSPVGIRGERLPLSAKLNIQLMRGLVKRPKTLILHDALEHKTHAEQEEMLKGIRQLMPDMTIIILKSGTAVSLPGSKAYSIDSEGLVKI